MTAKHRSNPKKKKLAPKQVQLVDFGSRSRDDIPLHDRNERSRFAPTGLDEYGDDTHRDPWDDE
jgi:hypothetical protein